MEYVKKDGKLYKITEEEVNVKALENEITNLEQRKSNIPEPKTEPDEETLEFYNVSNISLIEKENIEAELEDKKSLLKELRGIK